MRFDSVAGNKTSTQGVEKPAASDSNTNASDDCDSVDSIPENTTGKVDLANAPKSASTANDPDDNETGDELRGDRLFRWYLARTLFPVTIAWNYLLGRVLNMRDWWARIDEHVVIGAYPFSSDVGSFGAERIRGVVNTCEEYAGPVQHYRRAGIEQLHIPTIDFTSPTLADVEEGVAFIRKHASNGDTVYVHCKAGRGRSATVVVCYLIETRGMNPVEAQAFLLRKRPHAHSKLYEREVVLRFYERRSSSPTNSPEEASL